MKLPIVILHGWRKSGNDYSEIKSIFEKHNYAVFVPDMPGAGEEKLIKPVMHINDYISFILEFLKNHKLTKIILIGHSFGGRVAAKLTAQYPEIVDKLILTGAPLIKQRLTLKNSIIMFLAQIMKKFSLISSGTERMRKVLYYLLGEWDYYKAPPEIRETFKAIIAEDISPNLSNIFVPTLVLWGENDTFVSKKIGKEITRRIPTAKYIEIPGATHALPYKMPEKFAEEVLKFI